jgi:hypothetical protein
MNFFTYAMTGILFFFCFHANAQEQGKPEVVGKEKVLALSEAFLCENILNAQPKNRAVVFSIALEKIVCYTAFDPVPENSIIYHKWYHKDELNKKTRLSLKPPRWAVFSRILLREAHKGPWRIEIVDRADKVFQVLRFSIVD